MKHDKHELTHKKFIKAEKRLDEIYQIERSAPWRKLETPYQDGWKLIPVLREDLVRSDKGPIINALIERYRDVQYIKNPKFVSQIRKKPQIDEVRIILYHKKFTYNYAPCIRDINEREYNKLSEQQKKYFSLMLTRDKWSNESMYQFNIPRHYILIRVEKYMIGQVQDINSILIKEKAELKAILAPYWRTFNYGEGHYHYFERRRERRASKVAIGKIELE